MSFLKKLFGSGDSLTGVRRAHAQALWADTLALGEGVDRNALDPAARQELDDILFAAGDALAELNLGEGDACLRAGDSARAREHFRLAAAQARSEELAAEARNRLQMPASPPASLDLGSLTPACGGHCQGAAAAEAKAEQTEELDRGTRLELMVASYPAELAARYGRIEGPLLEALLLAHDGRDAEALARFDQVPPAQRDDLFFFERGALLAREGNFPEATADLEQALVDCPTNRLALETLVDIELNLDEDKAEGRLRRMLSEGLAPAFAHGRLAFLLARRDRHEEALDQAMQALQGGADIDTILLTAGLLEKAGRVTEAEALLLRVPSGGCGGVTTSLPLAEFWLRHQKNLDRVLDAFTGALRHDGNPRWRLRIAQVYLLRGWRKEARQLLEQIVSAEGIDPELARTASAFLDRYELGST